MPRFQARVIEHVYHPEVAPEEFQQVRIILSPGSKNEKLIVTLENEADMTTDDLRSVLKYLEKSTLMRMSINLAEDCEIYLKKGEEQKEIKFSDVFTEKR